jgi:transposase
MFTSGIDQHKRDSVITTYDATGRRVRQARLPNRPAVLAHYFAAFPGPHQAVVESTGRWYWLSDLLTALGIELQLAHAKALKAIAYAKVKTDPIDSDTLAVLRRAGLIPQAHMISPELRSQRDLLRTRLRLVAKRTSCRNSLHRLLEKFNVSVVTELAPLYQLQAACHEEQLALLAGQIKRLEQALTPTLLPLGDVQRLLWIPGIGKLTACTLYLEIDEITRFPSVRRFVSYCRLVPGAANSAGRTRHRSGSKDGNRYLKIAFSHAAVRAIQYYPEIRTYYRRLARRKNPRVARTLVAKELARIVYQVLATSADFNGQFKGVPLSRTKRSQWPRLASPDA